MWAISLAGLLFVAGTVSSGELSLAKYRNGGRRGAASPHIVGGVEAARGAWPWQGSLLDFFESHTCGCVLLSARFVLSAGHCVMISEVDVWLGIHDQSIDEGQILEVSQYHMHPDIDLDPNRGFPNDLAILELYTPADINDVVQPARLPPSADADYTSSECIITGWGLEDGLDFILPDVLIQARVDCLTTAECQAKWDELEITVPISNIHQCVLDKMTEERGSCNGDSGGPLNCKNAADQWELAGITSWGINGCYTSAPSVYVRVATYLEWINSIVS